MGHHYPRTKNAKLKHVESMSIAMHVYTYLLAANTCAKRGIHVPLHIFRDREPSLTRQKLPLIPSAHFCLHAGQGQTSTDRSKVTKVRWESSWDTISGWWFEAL